MRDQLAKDLALRAKRGTNVDELEWHFATSPKTGAIGPTKRLERELIKHKIKIVLDP